MKKILWLDTETTGLDCNKHGIIQIAMLIDIDGKLEGELAIDVQPFDDDYFVTCETEFQWGGLKAIEDLEASDSFEPSGILIYDVKDYHIKPKIAHENIIDFLNVYISKFDKADKAYLGGYNVNFDRGFISNWFRKCGDNYLGSYLNWKCLDPLYMLWQMDFDDYVAFDNYKLETACKAFDIEIEAHNAMSDIKATRELYYKLKEV